MGHYTNPLHVYCRLCDLRIPPKAARALARAYADWRVLLVIVVLSAAVWAVVEGVRG